MDLTIKSLSPQLLHDYLAFFDNMHFSEHPHWSKCYCYSYHFTGRKEEWTRERNRAAVITMIREDKMRGFLAYDGKEVVGWSNANDRHNFQALTVDSTSESGICSIVCFLIRPDYRRKGVSRVILEQIIDTYTRKGYSCLEAYPRKDTHSCEGNYHGYLKLYEKFNFRIEKELEDHYIVRKNLQD